MHGLDKERINKIIFEMSKDSAYFRNAKAQDEKVDKQVSIKAAGEDDAITVSNACRLMIARLQSMGMIYLHSMFPFHVTGTSN